MSSNQGYVDYNPQITLVKVPGKDYPQKQDVFQLKYMPPIPTDELSSGQVIVKNLFLSIDASMRIWISGVQSYTDPVRPGDLMKALGVAEVIYSKDQKFKVGDKVMGVTFWQKYSVLKGKQLTRLPDSYRDYSQFLGVLGISGLTAYFGLKKIGNLKQGETVVVSAAAGAVGEIAIQLAKNAGCVVVGIAGSKQKCEYVKSIGADFAIDYKGGKLKEKVKECCPKGVDVYFDNVGGQMLDELLLSLKNGGRVIACGAISDYNRSQENKYRLKNYSVLIVKRALIQGFIYFDYAKQFPEAIVQLSQLISKGKLRYTVDMHEGLEDAPKGLKTLLEGKNKGKVIVRVANSTSTKPNL